MESSASLWVTDADRIRPKKQIGKPKSANQITSVDTKQWHRVVNFTGLAKMPGLERISVNHSSIESFFGAVEQPSLRRLRCVGPPLGQYKDLALMALIVFGGSVEKVNGVKCSTHDYELADVLRGRLRPLLRDGTWVIVATVPSVRLLDVKTRRRKDVFYEAPKKEFEAIRGKPVTEDEPQPKRRIKTRKDRNEQDVWVTPDKDEMKRYLRTFIFCEIEKRRDVRTKGWSTATSSVAGRDIDSILARSEIGRKAAESVVDWKDNRSDVSSVRARTVAGFSVGRVGLEQERASYREKELSDDGEEELLDDGDQGEEFVRHTTSVAGSVNGRSRAGEKRRDEADDQPEKEKTHDDEPNMKEVKSPRENGGKRVSSDGYDYDYTDDGYLDDGSQMHYGNSVISEPEEPPQAHPANYNTSDSYDDWGKSDSEPA